MELLGYSGYYTDVNKLKESASGGAATILAECILEKKGVVFGVSYSADYKDAEYMLVDSIEKLSYIKGSKYIPSKKYITVNNEKVHVFSMVASMLRIEKYVLFIGLGCDIGALVAYLEKHAVDTAKLYTVDLICHGPTNQVVQRKYIEELEQRYRAKVIDFNLRYKKDGWVPPYIHVEFDNGKLHEESFYESDYCYAFGIYSKKSCYNCKFKGESHKADLTVGDYWGITPNMPGYNSEGVSVFLIRTEKGKDLLEMINTERFSMVPAEVDNIIKHNPMYNECRIKNEKWEEFHQLINNVGLKKAVVKIKGSRGYYFPKIKKYIKRFLRVK